MRSILKEWLYLVRLGCSYEGKFLHSSPHSAALCICCSGSVTTIALVTAVPSEDQDFLSSLPPAKWVCWVRAWEGAELGQMSCTERGAYEHTSCSAIKTQGKEEEIVVMVVVLLPRTRLLPAYGKEWVNF